MPKIFAHLDFLTDPEPHGAAWNMALDEALLLATENPVLRVYRWRAPAVSFGYFEAIAPVRAKYPAQELVRRWTGGGVVEHGEDFTYSLIVPRHDPLATVKPLECYGRIHGALVEALEKTGLQAELTPCQAPKISTACFENPAAYDIMYRDQKIAGAGQRRSRHGLLHQGSIQGQQLPTTFAEILATTLSARSVPMETSAHLESHAHTLANEKYATPGWTERF
ncbi:MAG: hypothetical protein QM796_04510 [Chthoniobacteraceae bacterium]